MAKDNYRNEFKEFKKIDGGVVLAITEFKNYLGEEGGWFVGLLEYIVKEWIDKGYGVSDILIREKNPPLVSINKAYIALVINDEDLEEKMKDLEETNFLHILMKLSSYDSEKLDKKQEVDYSTVSIDFSFLVEDFGIFRVNYSSDVSGKGFAIRYHPLEIKKINDYKYPEFYKNFLKDLTSQVKIHTPQGVTTTGIIKESGVVVHVGPTGAGKTTAMGAEVCSLAEKTSGTILTYDRPKEIIYPQNNAVIKQYEIGINIAPEDVEVHAIRNNPTIIQYGEARNAQEYALVASLASRGHLVFTTMHGSSTEEALVSLRSATSEHGTSFLSNIVKAIVVHKRVTTNKGTILSIFEIVVFDKDMIKFLEEDTFKMIASKIENSNGKEGKVYSFKSSLDDAVSRGDITKEERLALEI